MAFPCFKILHVAVACVLVPLAGCHAAYVQADIRNSTANPVTLVELDYPSASFGTGLLAAGATYHYRFKILGSGPTKLLWTDASQQEKTAIGPQLREGQEGSLGITITDAAPTWESHLKP